MSVPNVDGILLRGDTLWAVQNMANKISRVKLAGDLSSGTVRDVITSKHFDVPATIAKFGDTLAAVNAQFNRPASPHEVVLRVQAVLSRSGGRPAAAGPVGYGSGRLRLDDPAQVVRGFDRPNIFLESHRVVDERDRQLHALLVAVREVLHQLVEALDLELGPVHRFARDRLCPGQRLGSSKLAARELQRGLHAPDFRFGKPDGCILGRIDIRLGSRARRPSPAFRGRGGAQAKLGR